MSGQIAVQQGLMRHHAQQLAHLGCLSGQFVACHDHFAQSGTRKRGNCRARGNRATCLAPVGGSITRISNTEREYSVPGGSRNVGERGQSRCSRQVPRSAKGATRAHGRSFPVAEDPVAFEALTGCGVIINTSFNVRGEPIVCTPEEAYRCFMRTDMDYLVLGSYLLAKAEQPALVEQTDWRQEFTLD